MQVEQVVAFQAWAASKPDELKIFSNKIDKTALFNEGQLPLLLGGKAKKSAEYSDGADSWEQTHFHLGHVLEGLDRQLQCGSGTKKNAIPLGTIAITHKQVVRVKMTPPIWRVQQLAAQSVEDRQPWSLTAAEVVTEGLHKKVRMPSNVFEVPSFQGFHC